MRAKASSAGATDQSAIQAMVTTPLETPPLRRPNLAVVLAAGRSDRLREVTGGGSKALVRVGGMALVERAVRGLLDVGEPG